MEKKIEIVWVDPGEIKLSETNPRLNDAAVDAVASCIEKYGFLVPIVLDTNMVPAAGDTRVRASIKKNLKEIPAVIADHLTESQIRAFRIADNKLGEIAKWDTDVLRDELIFLKEANIDLISLGFDGKEIEDLFAECEAMTAENTMQELSVEDFFEEAFECKCPRCGFVFDRD